MFSRVLYRDDEVKLAIRWFGLGRVYVDYCGYVRTAHPVQAHFLTRVTLRLKRQGHKVRPPDRATRLFLRSFASALLKGHSHSYPWTDWFARGSQRVANDFIEQSRAKSTHAEP